jgi:uncharacterized protein (TIGR04255 family)
MQSRHVAMLWQLWRHEFPIWEDQPPLQVVREWFGVPGQPSFNLQFDLGALPPLRRAFFFRHDRTELRQVQPDRFVRNWRKIGDPYPRYDDEEIDGNLTIGLRSRFRADLERFITFAREEELGEFQPNQCEVTYVNHVPTFGDQGAEDFAELLAPWQGSFSDGFLKQAESAKVELHFLIPEETGKSVGRLHAAVAPARDQESGIALTRLTLTARGIPLGKGTEGVLAFLDLGRRHIVKGFASMTTGSMHKKWRRTNGG